MLENEISVFGFIGGLLKRLVSLFISACCFIFGLELFRLRHFLAAELIVCVALGWFAFTVCYYFYSEVLEKELDKIRYRY